MQRIWARVKAAISEMLLGLGRIVFDIRASYMWGLFSGILISLAGNFFSTAVTLGPGDPQRAAWLWRSACLLVSGVSTFLITTSLDATRREIEAAGAQGPKVKAHIRAKRFGGLAAMLGVSCLGVVASFLV